MITLEQARFIDRIRDAANHDDAVAMLLDFADCALCEHGGELYCRLKGNKEVIGMVQAIAAANALVKAGRGEEE